MFIAVLTVAVLAAPAALALDQDSPADKPPRKGDRVVVRGCVNGALLEAIETGAANNGPLLPPGLTFRLSGDKKLLKQMRTEENGRKVEITGILKSDLPQESGLGTQVGKTRIGIGVASPDTMQQQSPPHRPVIEVKSFEPLAVACGG
jgi:hypothetical protein